MTHSSPRVVYNPSENSCPTYPAILSTGCYEDFISYSVDIDKNLSHPPASAYCIGVIERVKARLASLELLPAAI